MLIDDFLCLHILLAGKLIPRKDSIVAHVHICSGLQSLASALPRNFLLNSYPHLGVGETLGKHQFLKICSPRSPEMVFTVPHGSRLYKVVPSPHKTSTCSKLFACRRKILLIYLSTSFAHMTKSAHLHTCDFCIAHPRSRQKR